MLSTRHWVLLFNDDVIDHIGERGFSADDASALVFGRFGAVKTFGERNKKREARWHCWGSYDLGGDLGVVILRLAEERDLRVDAFSVDLLDERLHAPMLGPLTDYTVVPVSMRGLEPDEVERYNSWRGTMKRKSKEGSSVANPTAPAFSSDAEEAIFWDTHSILDYEHIDLSDVDDIVPGAARKPARGRERRT